MFTAIAHRLFMFSPPRDEGDTRARRRREQTPAPVQDAASISAEPTASPVDAMLLERLRHGDTSALDELARRYMVPLSGIASAVVSSNALVDDVVQDVLLAVWEHRATLEVRTNLLGYLQRAVYNRALNVLRHERSQYRKATNAVVFGPETSRVAHNDAEGRLDAEDVQIRLQEALAHLPPSPRRVFLLSWQAGLSYGEIAQLLGITTRSVTKQMYRATQQLAIHFRRDS